MKRGSDFTQGPIFTPLIRFALPVLLALLLQTMYGAVDLLVVGRFANAADVSAVSTGSQLMHSVIRLTMQQENVRFVGNRGNHDEQK